MRKFYSSSLTLILLTSVIATIFIGYNIGSVNAQSPVVGTGTPQTFDAKPWNHFSDVGFVVTDPTKAYDGNYTSRASFVYSSGTGTQKALELYNFTSPAVAPWNSKAYAPLPTISGVDFYMKYNVSENTNPARDDRYRIVYRVTPSVTVGVLTDWRNDYSLYNLAVNAFDNTFTGWTRVGASPYLSAIDYPTNYVHTAANSSETIGYFDFADLPGAYSGEKIYLEVYSQTGGSGLDEIAVNLFDGTSSSLVGNVNPKTSWSWQGIDVTDKINSTSQVNGARVYFSPVAANPDSNSDLRIDAVRLRILKAGWMDVPAILTWANQPEPNDGVWSWTDINNIRFAVETQRVGTQDGGCSFWEYEAWVTVKSPPAVFKMASPSVTTTSTPSVVTIRPNLDVAQGWTESPTPPTTNYDHVDEAVQNGDTDYVYASAGARTDTYQFTDPVAQAWSIGSVRIVAYAKYSAAGPDEKLAGVVRLGIVNYRSLAAYELTTGYAMYSFDFGVRPDNGAAWAWTDITSLRAGIQSVTNGVWSGQMRVTQVYVEVLSAPTIGVSLRTEGAVNLWGYSLNVRYNTSVLTPVHKAGSGLFNSPSTAIIDDIQGLISFGFTMAFGTTLGAFGNVTVGTVYFLADSIGSSYFDMEDTKLTSPAGASMPHNIVDVDVDVTAVSASGSGSWTLAYPGYPRTITVTLKNKAYRAYDISVRSFLNASENTGQTVVGLAPGATTTFTITLDTTSVPYGDYKIWALAELAPNDVHGLGDGTVRVTVPGDVNGDKIVDVFDILKLKSHRSGPPPGPGGYLRDADINDDTTIDVFDILIAKAHLGDSW